MITTEVISSTEGLDQLADEWFELYNNSLTATPFQSPFWVIPWWRNFSDGELQMVVIRDNTRLVGLAPFYMYWSNNSERLLCIAGTGISDYLNVLYRSEYGEIVIDQICDYLINYSDEWDQCDFQELPEKSLLMSLRKSLKQCKVTMCKQSDCSFIEITPGGNLKKTLPPNLRKNIKEYLNRLRIFSTFQFEQTDSPGDLILLHGKRWHDKNQPGVLDNEDVKKFHRDVFEDRFSIGNVFYYLLKIENVPAACFYVLTRKTDAYFYLGGFDPLYKQYSPGTVTLFLTLQHLFKRGFTRFDFLRGNEAYKQFWGVTMKCNYRMQITKYMDKGVV